MAGREVLKESEGILRGIIRSIDKNLDYTLIDSAEVQGPRCALKLSLRGREATVSLSIDDLRSAGEDVVRKNAIRQKIKSTRDHMMDNHLPDVLGTKIARMLGQSAMTEENFKRPVFRRSPRR
ncbi:MAG: hypothetical protein ACREQA_20025 [Candidatus Binatia bacterium]